MSSESPLVGGLLTVVRLAFLFLLIAVVLLFILAKSGSANDDGEGASAEVDQFEVSEGEFGKGWTDLKYRVKYRWAGGKLKYELFLHPYDPRIEKLRKEGMELVLLSFVNDKRARVIPTQSPVRIEMRDLEPVEAENERGETYFTGWLLNAEIGKEEGSDQKIAAAEMGWLFSNDLMALLRGIRKERLLREARERVLESRKAGVSAR